MKKNLKKESRFSDTSIALKVKMEITQCALKRFRI